MTVDDEADEPDGTVTATVAAGFGWRVAEGGASAAVTVLDNDAAPAREAEGATIWLADMQVVDYENGTIGAANASLFSNVRGELDLDPKWLWYYAPGRTLRLAFATGVANVEGVTLQAGDVALAFPQGSAGSSGFTWTDVEAPGWSDGETVTAQLVKRSQSAVSNDATLGALSERAPLRHLVSPGPNSSHQTGTARHQDRGLVETIRGGDARDLTLVRAEKW